MSIYFSLQSYNNFGFVVLTPSRPYTGWMILNFCHSAGIPWFSADSYDQMTARKFINATFISLYLPSNDRIKTFEVPLTHIDDPTYNCKYRLNRTN